MSKVTVLFADNNPVILQIWSEILRRRNYDVIEASSTASAREIMNRGGVDMAIFDLRLEDDLDEEDESGMRLAWECNSLPVIILSGDTTTETLLQAVQSPKQFLSVLLKSQGPEVLLKEMEKILREKLAEGGAA